MASLSIYIVTFNCGRALVDVDAFAASLFRPYKRASIEELPDILVLSVQEIAPIAYSFLGGAFLSPYLNRILQAVQRATSPQPKYRHVATHNAGMTGIIVLAKPEIAARIQWTVSADVGVGHWQMGNKGAAGVRLGYLADNSSEVVEMTFVAAHLAPHEEQVERRNQDWEDIVRGLAFTPSKSDLKAARHAGSNRYQGEANPLLTDEDLKSYSPSGMFTSNSALFFAGDLNYRSNDVGPEEDSHVKFPQPTEDVNDPEHYSHLLEHDQLSRERKAGKTLQGLSESPVQFPPTYKYNIEKYRGLGSVGNVEGEPTVWYWAKHRYPSWCDRALFSSHLSGPSTPLEVVAYEVLPIQPTSDHRPVALALQLDTKRAMSSHPSDFKSPFPLDTRWREQRVAARRREIFVGLCMYLGWTWEGNGLLLATLVGSLGGWLVISSLIS